MQKSNLGNLILITVGCLGMLISLISAIYIYNKEEIGEIIKSSSFWDFRKKGTSNNKQMSNSQILSNSKSMRIGGTSSRISQSILNKDVEGLGLRDKSQAFYKDETTLLEEETQFIQEDETEFLQEEDTQFLEEEAQFIQKENAKLHQEETVLLEDDNK